VRQHPLPAHPSPIAQRCSFTIARSLSPRTPPGFNLHTAALLLPAWERDAAVSTGLRSSFEWLTAPLCMWERVWNSRAGRGIGTIAALAALSYATGVLFPITYTPTSELGDAPLDMLAALWREPHALKIQNRVTRSFTNQLIHTALQPSTLLYLYSVLLISSLGYVFSCSATVARGTRRGSLSVPKTLVRMVWRTALSAACVLYLGVTLMPLESIYGRSIVPLIPKWHSDVVGVDLRKYSASLHETLKPFHASSSCARRILRQPFVFSLD
jgi:hypothetical protein